MRKHPFLVFLFVVSGLIFAVISFMQSRTFAELVKSIGTTYLPKDLGISADFSQFGVKLFPPAVSIVSPRVTFREGRHGEMPTGTTIEVDRIDLEFTPFQLLTGHIEVEKILLLNGKIDLRLSERYLKYLSKPTVRKKDSWTPTWEDLLRVRARSVSLEDVELHVWVEAPGIDADASIHLLEFAQKSGLSGLGYQCRMDIRETKGRFPKEWGVPEKLGELKLQAFVNSTGLKVSSFSYKFPGLEIAGQGEIEGDVLAQKPGKSWAEIDAKGSIDEVIRLVPRFGHSLRKLPPAGKVEFQGRVEIGDLKRPGDTVRAEGQLLARAVKFKEWEVDSVEAVGNWSSETGEIEVKKARFSSPRVARAPGVRAASGGVIEAGPTHFNLNEPGAFEVPVKFEDADFHWMAGPAAEKVFPLQFRTNGTIQAVVTNPTQGDWGVMAQLGLSITDLSLDNQKLHLKKNRTEILRVAKVGLEGDLALNAKGLKVGVLKLLLPSSQIAVEGQVDFSDAVSLDLRTSGEIELSDIGQLVETEIRGRGSLQTHIHGPGSAIIADFDFNVKDGYFLKLALGDVKGRLTLEDDPELLIFKQLKAVRDRTLYVADGVINMKGDSTIKMRVDVLDGGRVEDMIVAFRDLVSDISWFPSTLKGETHGLIDISGGLRLDRLQIIADLNGKNWDYWGERFRRVTARAGFDRGTYRIERARIFKNTGFLDGRVSMNEATGLDWDLRSSGLSLGDFDRVAALDVPIRGRLSVNTAGTGKLGQVESFTQFSLSEMRVRGMPLPPSDLSIRTAKGITSLTALAFQGQANIQADYDWKLGGSSRVKGELRALDYSPVLLLLNPSSAQDPNLLGTVSGSVDLSFESGKAENATGRVSLTEYRLARTGTAFVLPEPVFLELIRGSFPRTRVRLIGKSEEMIFDVRAEDGKLNGALTGRLDLSILELFTSAIARASNAVDLDFTVAGTLKQPTLNGRAELQEGLVRVAAIETPFERVRGVITMRDWKLTLQSLQADIAQGRVTASGIADLFLDRPPALQLEGSLVEAKVKVFPFQYIKLRGKFSVSGTEIPYLVKGELETDSALSTEKVLGRQQAQGLKTASYAPPPTANRVGDFPLFKLAIDVEAEKGIQIHNDIFSGEVSGKIRVLNTIDAPRLLGSAVVLPGGKLTFNDREFAIQAANIEFDNPAVINPRFTLTGATSVSGKKVNLFATGRIDDFKIELTSDPPMPESEILQLLAIGFTSEDLRKFRANEGANVSDVFSLVLQSFDFNREFKEKTGFQVDLDQVVDSKLGQSAFRPQSTTTSESSPKIVLRRQVLKNVDVSVGSTLGVGSNTQRQLNAEYHVTPNFSVIGVWDSLQGVQTQERTSFGLDLQYKGRFK